MAVAARGPLGGAITDGFARADGAVGGSWVVGGTTNFVIVSQEIKRTPDFSVNQESWISASGSFTGPVEAWVMNAGVTTSGDYMWTGMYACMSAQDPNDAGLDGYVFTYEEYGTWEKVTLSRIDNQVLTTLSVSEENGTRLADGDGLGLSVSGGVVTPWRWDGTANAWGVWPGLSAATDSTYTSGYMAFDVYENQTLAAWDDIGMRRVVSDALPPPSRRHLHMLIR